MEQFKLLTKPLKNSHNNKPEVVYTDALRAYREGVKTLGIC